MVKKLCRWILYRLWGWKIDVTVDRPNKYILCLAPHTTNWDLLLGELYAHAEGFQCQFLMKKEWFFGPLGPFFRKIGGIPVWRSKHTSMTENLAAIAKDSKSFHLCITPEGTRSLNPNWKKGFYVIAQKAELPILLYGVDYEKRIIRCTRSITPSGDIDKDMRDIKLYYKDFKGKYPEKFTIGEL
ncbi:1-acyl-sn-glycerol-3-phosphate acyltransferase [Xylanibacter oryzae]|uniref:1-acyl-sn-glycerol-3-phosphate acyltransferase n=1 Tax=Xylanibacter oryzae TaxID=185293 RepID=UPI0004B55823|nr:1-acyl-sn-glycerol-3-phosphate acyltransferase [Xylanibacter oryzae]